MFQNVPKMKVGVVAVSRDCFPESLSVNRRKALMDAYTAKYDAEDVYECPVCIVESEIHMQQALEDIQAVDMEVAQAVHKFVDAADAFQKLNPNQRQCFFQNVVLQKYLSEVLNDDNFRSSK